MEPYQGPGYAKLDVTTYKGTYVQPDGKPTGSIRRERIASLAGAIALINEVSYKTHCSSLGSSNDVMRMLAFELFTHLHGDKQQ